MYIGICFSKTVFHVRLVVAYKIMRLNTIMLVDTWAYISTHFGVWLNLVFPKPPVENIFYRWYNVFYVTLLYTFISYLTKFYIFFRKMEFCHVSFLSHTSRTHNHVRRMDTFCYLKYPNHTLVHKITIFNCNIHSRHLKAREHIFQLQNVCDDNAIASHQYTDSMEKLLVRKCVRDNYMIGC